VTDAPDDLPTLTDLRVAVHHGAAPSREDRSRRLVQLELLGTAMPRAADAVGCNHPPGSIPDPPQLAEHAGTDSPGDPRSRFKVAVALSMRGSSRFSAVHQCEDTPAEVLAPVPGVPRRTGCEFSAHFISQVVMRIGVEPAADVEP